MEVNITCTTELVHGGCNACAITPSTSYLITFDRASSGIPLETLDVESLVMAVALKNGFRQELILDFGDEVILFKRAMAMVTMKEEYGQITYESQGKVHPVRQVNATPEAIFEETNHILTTLFQIEPVTFTMEEVEA